MNLRRQRFVVGSTPTLRFAPPEGPPSGTLGCVVTNAAGGAVHSAAPSAPAATTLSTAAAYGADLLDVGALTGMTPGLDIWVGTAGTTIVEQAVIKNQESGDLRLYRPLQNAHATGLAVTVGELSISSALLAAALGDLYQVKWSYTVTGVGACIQYDTYAVVNRVLQLHLTPNEMSLYLPTAVLLGAVDLPFLRLLRLAQERVEEALVQVSVNPDLVRTPAQLNRLAAYAMGMLILERDATLDTKRPEVANRVRELWRAERERLSEAGLEYVDLDDDGAVGTDETEIRRQDAGPSRFFDFRRTTGPVAP